MASAPPPDDRILTLDLRGLKCPMPVLRTRKALRRMAEGARLEVVCTDPLAAIDIPHLLRQTGDVLDAQRVEAGVLFFVIQKAQRKSPAAAHRSPQQGPDFV